MPSQRPSKQPIGGWTVAGLKVISVQWCAPGAFPVWRWLLRVMVVAALGLSAALPARAQEPQPVPALQARVTDLTGTLNAEQRAAIESSLADLEQAKGAQVAVLIVPTTVPEAIEAFSLRVVEAWQLGRARAGAQSVDDGVLLIVAKNDRKLRIEVGRGLEGAIPDALAKRIIAETIAPRFRQGDFAGGIVAGVAEITRLIQGEELPPPWQHAQDGDSDEIGWDGLVLAIVIGLVLSAVLGRVIGAMVGASGLGVVSVLNGVPLVIAVVIGIVGFFGLLIVASLFGRGGGRPGGGLRSGRGGHRDTGWPGVGAGGWGGGGSSSSGGFSGGGGGFGGGGASGDW